MNNIEQYWKAKGGGKKNNKNLREGDGLPQEHVTRLVGRIMHMLPQSLADCPIFEVFKARKK